MKNDYEELCDAVEGGVPMEQIHAKIEEIAKTNKRHAYALLTMLEMNYNDALACYKLGEAYYKGDVGYVDYTVAEGYLAKSAKGGYAPAYYYLAEIFSRKPTNINFAVSSAKRAVELGVEGAPELLERMLNKKKELEKKAGDNDDF